MDRTVAFRITLILKHQPDGVITVKCKELPELLTEGDSVEKALERAKDAFITTLELYEDYYRKLPSEIIIRDKAHSKPKFSTLTPTEGVSDWCFQAIMPFPQGLDSYATLLSKG